MSQIPFLVETSRILEILSKQIYDSPYAMVRENVQNAYDAVLMRAKRDGKPPSSYTIDISATPQRIEIRDSGIGMSEAVLRENFWRAGSSGKNNPEARAAGVIGTFGIGAMANFGVCDRLQVDTREIGSRIGIRTSARKADLSIGAECITLETLETGIEEGTSIVADISPAAQVDVQALRNYISPFIRFLEVPVRLNGELLSGQDPRQEVGIGANWRELTNRSIQANRFSFQLAVLTDGSQIGVVAHNFVIDGASSPGGLWLRHRGGQIMGLRSRFGLAPVPLPSLYQLGGLADLPFLFPTAGREALTRESIQEAAGLIPAIEAAITESVLDTELADSLVAFQQHVLQLGQISWAGRVSVQLSPGDRRIEMAKLKDEYAPADLHWYAGSDPETINVFSSQERPLIRVSSQNPRRDLQQRYLREVLGLQAVPDTASIIETYKSTDLSWNEVTLMLAIARVLKSDYLIDDVHIEWVKISHGVSMLTESVGEKLILRLSRAWNALQAILKVIDGSPELVEGLTKDLVRVHIYEKIKSFVPSSQRAGLDALQKTLARRRELYRLEVEDRGELEPLLAEYLAGKIDFQEVLTAASHTASGHSQRVSSDSVGEVENVLVDVVNAPTQLTSVQTITVPVPGSPILRVDMEIRERLLIADKDIPQLNNHRVFLALSDRLFQQERDFFAWPHSTQVAWAGRRIVFLFGLAQTAQSLYYDIELKGARSAGDAGGTAVITTTIVAKNRIFVPVPQQLAECFKVTDSPVEFYVRFDLLGHK
jgi:molecular chaperone HtpG